MPVFESKLPEHIAKKLPDESRWIADTISIQDQRQEWMAQHLLTAYNTSQQTAYIIDQWMKKPLIIIGSVVAVVFTAVVGYLIQRLFGGGPVK